MPTLGARLDFITSSMPAKERAILALKAFNEGVEADPQLRRIDDPIQARIFDRYMGLIYVANVELDGVCQGILYYVERLQENTTVELLREAAAQVQAQTGESVDPRVVRYWRKHSSMTNPEFFYGVADEVRRLVVLPDVLARCREMASLEVVWTELSAEFNGQDIRSVELKLRAEDAWSKLDALLVRFGPKRRPMPDEQLVELIRAKVVRAFEYLRLVEVNR